MRIRVLSVFEGVIYHCWPVDQDQPCRPRLEVEAILRPGDADAEAGPLLLSVADYIVMAGGLDVARDCLRSFAEQGRIVTHLDAQYLSFPTWFPATDADPRDAVGQRTEPGAENRSSGDEADDSAADVGADGRPEAPPRLSIVADPDERSDPGG